MNKDISILIVEDEPILALSLEMKLKDMGLSVSAIASSPDEARRYTHNLAPDLVLMDINLKSSESGIDVANYIWKSFNIPIIFLTSYYNDKTIQKAMEAEPYAYLLKPCRDEELKAAISTVIHKHNFFFKNKDKIESSEVSFIPIEKNVKFDRLNSLLYIKDELFPLTKNEKRLFDILCKRPGSIVSSESILNFVWRENMYDSSKLRSMLYRLKNKLGFNPFENIYEEGYRIKLFEKSS